jgi:DNA-binding NtrC family response regulator
MELNKPKKIFIVDADIPFAKSLQKYLSAKANHEVHLYSNCIDCLNDIGKKPQIIILDNELNTEHHKDVNMKMLEVIKRDYPEVHVIVLAKDEGYGTAMQTILKGAEQYLIKDEKTLDTINEMIGEL